MFYPCTVNVQYGMICTVGFNTLGLSTETRENFPSGSTGMAGKVQDTNRG